MDINKDGSVDFDEFKVLMNDARNSANATDEAMIQLFKVCDGQQTGSGTTERHILTHSLVETRIYTC